MSYQKIVSSFIPHFPPKKKKENRNAKNIPFMALPVELLWNHNEPLSWCHRYQGRPECLRLYFTPLFIKTLTSVSDSLTGLQDCESGIKDFFNNKLYIIGYVGIGIAGVMVSQTLKTHFFGGVTHSSAVAWGWALLSADHRDDLQYGALLCHPQQQGGHLRLGREHHSTSRHRPPRDQESDHNQQVPSCNQLILPEFPFIWFFFFFTTFCYDQPVETVWFLAPTWQSSTYLIFFFMAIWKLLLVLIPPLSE